jgi:serine protease Do
MTEQSNYKNSKKAGIVWFAIFMFVFVATASSFTQKGKGFLAVFSRIDAKLFDFVGLQRSSKYTEPKTMIKEQVIQEESVVTQVVDKVSPAVVSVVVKTINLDYFQGLVQQESGIGTGFIVDPNGLIITNSHVVDNVNGKYSVILKDGTTYDVSKINLDTTSDIAILEINARNLPTVEFGDSDMLKVGQRAIAIGNALGRFQNTVTSGVVSGIGRQIAASAGYGAAATNYESVIQTDASINPGNSGGPLLNSAGQVIGVNVATALGANNISFAIPINVVKPILASFIKDGRIVRPYMGVQYSFISADISKLQNLPQGAYISRVVPLSPADKAGLKRGDIVTKINDKVLTEDTSLSGIVSHSKVGDTLNLIVDRLGKVQTFQVTLAEFPSNP